jgi:predicted nucleic acid-binding protein
MTYLLDVSTLLALLTKTHVHHARVLRWEKHEDLALCPITELGFVRIASQPAFGFTVDQARTQLADFYKQRFPDFVPCDVKVLESDPAKSSSHTTDAYLASLAHKHKRRFATLDEDASKAPAGFLIP